jgi:hypothetical protein
MDKTLIILKCVAVAAVFSVLTACATSPVPLGLPCSVGPVVLDKGATTRLTRGEKEQIVALNETGERLCRWRAP